MATATIPLTTGRRDWATHIAAAGAETGLAEPSWIMCEQVSQAGSARSMPQPCAR